MACINQARIDFCPGVVQGMTIILRYWNEGWGRNGPETSRTGALQVEGPFTRSVFAFAADVIGKVCNFLGSCVKLGCDPR
jgi:hypothetical protein